MDFSCNITRRKQRQMDKIKRGSPDMIAENIEKIAEIFPNCVSEALDKCSCVIKKHTRD